MTQPVTAQPRIIQALLKRAHTLSHPLTELAAELGVTVGYIAQLRVGQRDPAHCTQDFVVGCAHYLDVPPICVKILCGQVRLDDFKMPAILDGQPPDGEKELLSDPYLRSFMPMQEYLEASAELKEFITFLYQEATDMHSDSVLQLPTILKSLYSGVRVIAPELMQSPWI